MSRPTFVAPLNNCVLTCCGDTWDEAREEALSLNAPSNWSSPRLVFSDWPLGPPVALIPDRLLLTDDLENRSTAAVRALGKRLSSCLAELDVSIEPLVFFATSHVAPEPVSLIASSSLESRQLPSEQCRAALVNLLSLELTEQLGDRYCVQTLCAACASALVATVEARNYVAEGVCDLAVVVAMDVLSRVAYTGFQQVGAMSKNGCTPFDVRRDGITIGEAAVAFLVGTASSLAGHARMITPIQGTGIWTDCRHPVEPSAEGIASAWTNALKDAGIGPSEVGAVVLHGSGTRQNDAAEVNSLKHVFGDSLPKVTANKGTFGHTMGASGAMNLLCGVDVINRGLIPPVAGLEESEWPEIPFVRRTSSKVDPLGASVLVSASGFGGINAAILLGNAAD